MYYPIFDSGIMKLSGFVAATLLLFLTVFIISAPKRKGGINTALIMISLVVTIQTYYLMIHEWPSDSYKNIFLGLPMLLGPPLLFYMQNHVGKKDTIQLSDYINGIPFLVVTVLTFYPNFNFSYYPILLILIIIVHWAIFLAYTGYWLYTHMEDLKELPVHETKWIKVFFLINLSTWFMHSLLFVLQDSFRIIFVTFILLSSLIMTFFYFRYRNSQLSLIAKKSILEGKKQNTRVSLPENTHIHLNKLHKLMNEDRLYLDANLTIPKTAEKMRIQPYLLSQIINTHFAQSFPDYVNSFRIANAKKLLQESTLKISSIGLDSGFNTLSSFNLAFKKVTQRTPSDYRSLYKND